VSANGNTESEAHDCQTANNKRCARQRIGKEDEGGDGKKESGWHGQQTGVLHGRSFPNKSGHLKSA
jgi:hypothetical protein